MTILTPQSAIAVRQVDLRQPLRGLTDITHYHSVRLFVMWDDCPLGSVDIANHYQPINAARLRAAIVDKLVLKLLKPTLAQHYRPTGDGAAVALPPKLSADVRVSVVVATRDRPDDLRICLRGLVAQRSPYPVEIIVVDNHPASGLTPPVVAEFPDVVLVNEPRQGLAYARNAGFIASQGDIVATTDDDVTTPPGWLEKLFAPFVRPDVLAVTSNILPLELETTAQCLFEAYGGLGRGFDVRIADWDWFARFGIAVPTWKLGATANAAFRATIFSNPQIGLMDESLGPGMPSGVGEDTYLFYKVLKAGHTIVYEPSAYVWHKHRRTLAALRYQLYNYSKGHVAYHLTTLLRDHDLRALVRLMCELPWSYAVRLSERLCGRSVYPVSLLLLEIAGNLVGPWALWQSRRRVKRQGRSGPYVPVCQRSAAVPRSTLLAADSTPSTTLQSMSGRS
jgi:glycosyltransferase involved in cell wall biosynthesis